MKKLTVFCVILLAVYVEMFPIGESEEIPENHEEQAKANPLAGIIPGSGDTSTTAQPETGGGLVPGLPELPGASNGQASKPTLVLGAFQAIITPFDPSMMGQIISGLGGAGGVPTGGLPGLPGLPGGSSWF